MARDNNQKLVIVGHSWGAFLSYAALAVDVSSDPVIPDLFLSLGSPLGTQNSLPFPSVEYLASWTAVTTYVNAWVLNLGIEFATPAATAVYNIWAPGDLISGPLLSSQFNTPSLENEDLNSTGIRGDIVATCIWHWFDSLQPNTEMPCHLDVGDYNNQPLRNRVRDIILSSTSN